MGVIFEPFRELYERYFPEVSRACEEAHPRTFSPDYLVKTSGRMAYQDMSEDLTLGIGKPNWDLLDRPKSNVRPLMFLAMIGGMGKDPGLFAAYAAIPELIHNGTLIHDDIEDRAEVRRNGLPIHVKYGLDVAVNSANLLYFSPFLLLNRPDQNVPDSARLAAYSTIIEHLNRVTWGQAIDIAWHNSREIPSLGQYLQMCCYKTGAIDRLTASLAGIFAGLDSPRQEKLAAFGESLGICLQMHDDISDACAQDRSTIGGKTKGNDIAEGKKSLVNILVPGGLSAEEGELFTGILLAHTSNPEQLRASFELMEKSGALEKSLRIAEAHLQNIHSDSVLLFWGEHGETIRSFITLLREDLGKKYASRFANVKRGALPGPSGE